MVTSVRIKLGLPQGSFQIFFMENQSVASTRGISLRTHNLDMEKNSRGKSPASSGIQTLDLLIMRRVLCHCAPWGNNLLLECEQPMPMAIKNYYLSFKYQHHVHHYNRCLLFHLRYDICLLEWGLVKLGRLASRETALSCSYEFRDLDV